MKTTFTKLALSCLLVLTALATTALADGSQGVKWTQDYSQAVQMSKETHKPILLLFTGSGWCPYCNKIEKEVFSNAQFGKMAGDKYIFVMLDFAPNGKAKSQAFAQQHQELSGKYKIEGFPTVIVLDQNEKLLARTGYRPGGGEQYAKFLESQVGR